MVGVPSTVGAALPVKVALGEGEREGAGLGVELALGERVWGALREEPGDAVAVGQSEAPGVPVREPLEEGERDPAAVPLAVVEGEEEALGAGAEAVGIAVWEGVPRALL